MRSHTGLTHRTHPVGRHPPGQAPWRKRRGHGQPIKTTVSNPETAGPEDWVNRPFTAARPNAL